MRDVAADLSPRSFDGDDDFDLDRDAGWQRANADRRAGVPTRVAKDLDEKIRATIDDLRVVLEIGRGVDHPEHIDDPLDSIEITANLGICRGRATVWTCDLTKEYVAINGDYRS